MAVVAPPAKGVRSGDAFVILTGGGTPLSNEYSHYLQARAMSQFFRERYPAESIWTFFGIGNRDGAAPILADVHREVKDARGRLVDTWLTGTLPANRPATRASFLTALRDEILPRVASGGTLYLFIGDHGELTDGKKGESAVTLWQLRRGRRGRWDTDESEVLTVSDLRAALAVGLGKGRVVFCMTQCHGGGFHFLGVPRDLAKPDTALPRVAGFTATDEANLAAGCVADPDPEKWQGYERYLPQALLGTDLLSGARQGPALGSFAAAHEAATLVDRTIDKPYSSSDQFLERWATRIETDISRSLTVSDAEGAAAATYAGIVDARHVKLAEDPSLAQRVAQFRKFTDMLAARNAATAHLLRSGTRAELQAALAEPEPSGPRGGRRRNGPSARRVWADTLRPAWAAAVKAGQVSVLPAAALAFEQRLLKLEEDGRDYFTGTGRRTGLLNEIYWGSGLSEPIVKDRAKADAVPRWALERRERILAWAKAAESESVRAAAAAITQAGARNAEPAPEREPTIDPTAVERVLFYRRVLGAWQYLILTQNRAALAQLAALIEVENTPLPAATGGKVAMAESVASGGN